MLRLNSVLARAVQCALRFSIRFALLLRSCAGGGGKKQFPRQGGDCPCTAGLSVGMRGDVSLNDPIWEMKQDLGGVRKLCHSGGQT